MRIDYKTGLLRLWLVCSLIWIAGSLLLQAHELSATYRYYFDRDAYEHEVAEYVCRLAGSRNSIGFQTLESPPVENKLSLEQLKIAEAAARKEDENDRLACDPLILQGYGQPKSQEDISLCFAKRQDTRDANERIRLMHVAQKQAEADRLAQTKCIADYDLSSPDWGWLLLSFAPPTIGVAMSVLFLWAMGQIGAWIWRGFKS